MSRKKKREHVCWAEGWFVYKYGGAFWAFNTSWHPVANHEKFATRKAAYLWCRAGCFKRKPRLEFTVHTE